jgi:hypothetical protein
MIQIGDITLDAPTPLVIAGAGAAIVLLLIL